MTGTCSGTIDVSPAYREATLASCQFPTTVVVGQPSPVTLVINQGSVSEYYKVVFSGDLIGESPQFIVSAGAGQQQIIRNITFTTTGTKNITISLVKV